MNHQQSVQKGSDGAGSRGKENISWAEMRWQAKEKKRQTTRSTWSMCLRGIFKQMKNLWQSSGLLHDAHHSWDNWKQRADRAPCRDSQWHSAQSETPRSWLAMEDSSPRRPQAREILDARREANTANWTSRSHFYPTSWQGRRFWDMKWGPRASRRRRNTLHTSDANRH